jgi:glycine betaine/proline transport system permease protein
LSATGVIPEAPRPLSAYPLLWAGLVIGAILIHLLGIDLLRQPPAALLPVAQWLTSGWDWFVDARILGLFTFKELTRALVSWINYPMELTQVVLAPDFQRPVWLQRLGLPKTAPSLPWITVAGLAAIAGHYAGGWRIALMMFVACLYFAAFGMWNSTMLTLASVIVSVPVGVILGVACGVWCYRSERARKILLPILDLMQTVPFFSYMVPIVVLFGVSPVAGVVATVIFSMPPMVRVTELALRQVPSEIVDFGRMAGCRRRQLMWLVQLPAARDQLLVGLNQVVMLTLNLVILASVIGARGLGFDVWNALNRLNIGKGLEFGMAIVFLAIVLDRYLRALATRRPHARSGRQALQRWEFLDRHPYWTVAGAYLVISIIFAIIAPPLYAWPKEWATTTAPFWNALMTAINTNYFWLLNGFREAVVLYALNPLRDALLAVPWIIGIAALGLLGWRLGGARLALLVMFLSAAIAAAGLWGKAMLTIYECGAAVLFCVAVGFPLGIWAARNEQVWRILEPVADLLQTIPSFIFLIPFVILFRTGEFTAILIVISFAIVPAIRYTAEGIRNVPGHLIEAAKMQGCSPSQILWQVQLPLAQPQMLLGLNQTILMALSMLVITAYAGTNDLGQDALAGVMKRNLGQSVLAGLAICAIAVITDRLITAKAKSLALRAGLKA